MKVHLAAEAVQGLALTLERVDHVHGGDGLAASMLGVGDGVTDHGFQEGLEHTAGLLVDEAADALDTTSASQAADSRLGDAVDVVAEDLAVTLGAALAQTFTTLTTSSHVVSCMKSWILVEQFTVFILKSVFKISVQIGPKHCRLRTEYFDRHSAAINFTLNYCLQPKFIPTIQLSRKTQL